jgi:streptogramin lyase
MVIPYNYNPVVDGPFPDSLSDTTDASGTYSLAIADTSITYNIQAVHLYKRTMLLITAVSAGADTTYIPPGTLKDPGHIKLFLSDTVDTINGYVYIEGTTLYAYLTETVSDSNGLSVIIDSVPAADVPNLFYDRQNNPPQPTLLSQSLEVISNDTMVIDPFISWIQYTTANSDLPENRVDEVYVCFSSFPWMQDSISIWLTTNTSGIVVYNKSTWTIYDQSTSSIPTELITQVLRYDDENWVWVSSTSGIFKFDGSDWQVWDTLTGLPSNRVFCMALNSNGDIWAGMNQGIGFFDNSSEQWTEYDTAATGLKEHNIKDVAVDKNDNPWYATTIGVGHFNGSSWQVYTQASGLLTDNTFCVAVDSMNNVWIGHEDGGLSRYDSNQWTTFTSADSKILNGIIREIVPDKNNNIWICAETGLTMFDGTEWKDFDGERFPFLENKSIRSMAIDDEGTVWAGTTASGVIGFGPAVK